MEAIRLILSYAFSKRINVYHMDVNSNFQLEEESTSNRQKDFYYQKINIICVDLKNNCMELIRHPKNGIQHWTGIFSNNDSRREM
jgi:hypothetical protein